MEHSTLHIDNEKGIDLNTQYDPSFRQDFSEYACGARLPYFCIEHNNSFEKLYLTQLYSIGLSAMHLSYHLDYKILCTYLLISLTLLVLMLQFFLVLARTCTFHRAPSKFKKET